MSNGGKPLVEDGDLMLAHGRRYGLVGRNGTGKTSFLRALMAREVRGLPEAAQVLHVEQEVAGDATPVLQARPATHHLAICTSAQCFTFAVSI